LLFRLAGEQVVVTEALRLLDWLEGVPSGKP
jgi:hypothetical protein